MGQGACGQKGRQEGQALGALPARDPIRAGVGTQLRHLLSSVRLSPAPPFLSFPGVVTAFLQVLGGLESRAQGGSLKWDFLPHIATPTAPHASTPRSGEGSSGTQLVDKELPQPSSGLAGHKFRFSRVRVNGRSRAASQGLWGKLQGLQGLRGKNLSLTSHPATLSLLLTHIESCCLQDNAFKADCVSEKWWPAWVQFD